MTEFSFNTTPRMIFAEGAAGSLGTHCAGMMTRALVVTDANLRGLGLLDAALGSLKAEGIDATIYDGVAARPARGVRPCRRRGGRVQRASTA